MKSLLIKNAFVVDPRQQTCSRRDIFVHEGKFADEKQIGKKDQVEVLSLEGKYLLPGLIDLRCHAKNVLGGSEENIKSVSETAAQSGFTSLLLMPDISPIADNPGAIRYINECAEKYAVVKIKPAGALTNRLEGQALAPLGSLREAGVSAVTDCPLSAQNNQIFIKGVEYASMFNLPVIEFPRDHSLSSDGNAHDSVVSLAMGLGGYPRMAEELFVQRSITASKNLHAHIHLSSISSKGSVELIEDAKNKGINVTADTTPHHLCLTDESIRGYNTHFKTLPPLREEEDRKALIKGLAKGTIDSICTAHQPHQDHLKNAEYDISPAGVTSLDTCLFACLSLLGEEIPNLPLKISEWLSYNPAQILNSESGTIDIGSPADFIIIDLETDWIYQASESPSMSSNNPFSGQRFNSVVEMTFVDGKLAFQKGP